MTAAARVTAIGGGGGAAADARVTGCRLGLGRLRGRDDLVSHAYLHEAFSNRSGVPPEHFELYYRGSVASGSRARRLSRAGESRRIRPSK